MELTREDLELLRCDPFFLVEQVDLSIGSYYSKFCNINTRFMELFGAKVFDLVGIKHAEYVYIPEKGCLLSKDLNSEERMYSCYDLYIMRANILRQVFEGLDNLDFQGGYDVRKAKLQLEIMHFIDILFSNIDRHISNFGFYLNVDGLVELVVLDNEYFLQNFKIATRPMAFTDDEMENEDFMGVSKRYEAIKFFETMSDEMRELVPKYLDMFIPQRVEAMITSIENEQCLGWPLKRYSMKHYRKNYNMICKLFGMNNKRIFGRTLKK